MTGTILLYYKYVSIPHPKQIQKWLTALCKKLELTGRIIIAHEGINGTVGGATAAIKAFKKEFLSHPLFVDTDVKESQGSADDFPRLSIKVRTEVVSLGVDPEALTTKNTGIHLSPDQTHEIIEHKKDLVILDARNNYESRIGKFKGAITPDIRSFHDFPKYIDQNLEQFKNKEVLMYCTGGVRCERATAYLAEKNISKNIYQVDGGICRYVEKYPDGFFRGKNYVFDARVAVTANDDILTECDLCQEPCADYTNCINTLCNKQFIACASCRDTYEYTCSSKCHLLVKNKKVPTRPDRINATPSY